MLVRIEDIEEFELVGRVPRQSITDEVLRGIRNLDERKHIEPFLRDILADWNETPHTSTEIADILTTTVTLKARPQFAAFVNKGKSYKTVTARKVSHQILRLQQLRQLDLIVLLAVGRIQDDAIRDLVAVSESTNAHYCLIDAVDVARLFIVHNKVCPKDGRAFSNGRCPTCGHEMTRPLKLTFEVYEEPRYEILEHEDTSHALARRYSAKVLADIHYSKTALREVVKRVIWTLRQSDFSRSDMVASHFGDKPPDYIDVFVFKELSDTQHHNWICKAVWVDPELPEEARPLPLNGDEQLGEIEISWNPDYSFRRSFGKTHRGSKENWRKRLELVLPRAEALLKSAIDLLEAYRQGSISESAFCHEMSSLEENALELTRITGTEFPPLECEDCDRRFESMVGSCHNIFVPYASWGIAKLPFENRLRMTLQAIDLYLGDRRDFLYELKKVGVRLSYRPVRNQDAEIGLITSKLRSLKPKS